MPSDERPEQCGRTYVVKTSDDGRAAPRGATIAKLETNLDVAACTIDLIACFPSNARLKVCTFGRESLPIRARRLLRTGRPIISEMIAAARR
jgi:hypothetical protein